MNELERERRYLSIYRRQLKRDLDAMGYGKQKDYSPNLELDTAERTSPSIANLVGAVAAMRLLGVHL